MRKLLIINNCFVLCFSGSALLVMLLRLKTLCLQGFLFQKQYILATTVFRICLIVRRL